MKKILLICATSQSIITFRKKLICALQDDGYSVSAVAFDNEFSDDIRALNVDFYSIEDSNRSINPLRILFLKSRYKKLIKQLSPDIVFTFMLKPNIFGVLAAKSLGVKKIFSMVEGLGDVFINNSYKWRIIRVVVCFLYRYSFRYVRKVFFLNNDDKQELITRKIVNENQCALIRGIGVDLEHFSKQPINNYKTFLMIARMLETKGTYEYFKCARQVRKEYPEAVFNYLGAEGNIKIDDIKEYIEDGSINYLGTAKDVRPIIEKATVIVLPSYREGCPMSIMEAESIGRGIIATDSVGCRETVIEGYNGFLVPPRDVDALVEKCKCILEKPQIVDLFAENSHDFAEKNFDSKKINAEIIYKLENV